MMQDNLTKYYVLNNIFRLENFRPHQEQIIDILVRGENVLAVMPTGAGKSLCFQIPALVRGGLTIVISPLIALMQDQIVALKKLNIAAASINSSASRAENIATWRRVEAGEVKLLYMSPERLMTKQMLFALKNLDVQLMIIDEAQCISQWGASFRPEYEKLQELKSFFPSTPIGAFTATADKTTQKDIAASLFHNAGTTIISSFNRPNISLDVKKKYDWKKQLLEFLCNHPQESGIVYCLSRTKTAKVTELLHKKGYQSLAYHAGMSSKDRMENQERFLNEQGIIMVATIAFGMGINKKNVRFIFHIDIPNSIESYYQEIGRAGRDGAPAYASLIYGPGDIHMRRLFIEKEKNDSHQKIMEHGRLDSLVSFCETTVCRRIVLLEYFGERITPCGNCDICIDPPIWVDGTKEAALILGAISATGERFGRGHITDILLGNNTAKVIKFGHNKLAVFGHNTNHTKNEWNSIIQQLIESRFLRVKSGRVWGMKLTEKGSSMLKHQLIFKYRSTNTSNPPPALTSITQLSLDKEDSDLYERLRVLRKRISAERGIPAYRIFTDKCLLEITKIRPLTKHHFLKIHGIGPVKARDFSKLFINEIRRTK